MLRKSPSKCSETSSNNSEDEFSSNECESNKKPKKNRSIGGNRSMARSQMTSAPLALHAQQSHFCTKEDTTDKCKIFLKQSLNNIQFSRSSVGGSKYLVNAHTNVAAIDSTGDLMFESRFESGNLAKVIKVTPVYYELYLRPDLYTNKHTQWFYFRVTNTRKNLTYRFVCRSVWWSR